MSGMLLMILLILLMIYLQFERVEWVVVYEGSESTIGESQQVYFALKNNQINCRYVIPINWNNFANKKYEECQVLIRVHKKDEEQAKRLMSEYYNKRKMVV